MSIAPARRRGPRAPRRAAAAVLTALVILAGAAPRAGAAGPCDGIAPVTGTTLDAWPVVTGLAGNPLLVTAPPGDTERIFVVEQDGPIRIHRRGDPPGVAPVFLDLTAVVQAAYNEMGLLGLAFDPDYAQNGFFYVNYTEGPLGGPWFTVVARYTRSAANPDAADPASEVRLLRLAQPETNHNGGQVMFGPDGYLYVATGDGGGSNDEHGACGNGQNRATLLGKMLRLDVREIDPLSVPPDCGGAGALYRVPSTNPYALAATSECGEIWAYGLRNPWRSAFDPLTSDLFIADVGQSCWEEINALPGGGPGGANLGWRVMEGTHCFSPVTPFTCDPTPVRCSGSPDCNDPGLVLPIAEYAQAAGGCSVTGGVVYRGCQMPDLAGTYFYGDYCMGFVRSLRLAGGVATDMLDRTAEVDPAGSLSFGLTSFGTDGRGEVHIVHRSGFVLKVGPPFAALEVSGPGAGVPFTIGSPAWTWEDLARMTGREVARYRLYRGTPGGAFTCIATSPSPMLFGGDAAVPPPGGRFAYVVTAVSASGEETVPGIAGTSFMPGGCL